VNNKSQYVNNKPQYVNNKPQYIHTESYKHKMSKDVLKNWFFSDCKGIGSFKLDRIDGIWFEYPICIFDGYSSWTHNWNEIANDQQKFLLSDKEGYIPTYEECKDIFKSYPIAIIDVVCASGGNPKYGFEICHKNPVSKEKLQKLFNANIKGIYEVNADWILNQVKPPNDIKCNKLL